MLKHILECTPDEPSFFGPDDPMESIETTSVPDTMPTFAMKVKKVRRKCSHGRERRNCKQCEGSNICAHGKRVNNCAQCRRSVICKRK